MGILETGGYKEGRSVLWPRGPQSLLCGPGGGARGPLERPTDLQKAEPGSRRTLNIFHLPSRLQSDPVIIAGQHAP